MLKLTLSGKNSMPKLITLVNFLNKFKPNSMKTYMFSKIRDKKRLIEMLKLKEEKLKQQHQS